MGNRQDYRHKIDQRDRWIDQVWEIVLGLDYANDSARMRELELLFNEAGNPTFYDEEES